MTHSPFQTPKFVLVGLVVLTLSPGCALFKRSKHATHTEDDDLTQITVSKREDWVPEKIPELSASDESDRPKSALTANQPMPQAPQDPTERPPQKNQAASSDALRQSALLFGRALKEQNDAAYQLSSQLWTEYLSRFTGMPGFERAQYNLALCFFHLGRFEAASDQLHPLIASPEDAKLSVEARLLLSETLFKQLKTDEALAVTYELLPDHRLETQMGITRSKKAVGTSKSRIKPDVSQEIRLLLIRARIFAELSNQKQAQFTLAIAKEKLSGAKSRLGATESIRLTAHWAHRKLEVLESACRQKHVFPEKLSEAEFIEYSEAHYACADSARALFCQVLAAKDEQIKSQALLAYKALALRPLKLAETLPPPARRIKNQDQKPFYEREMKELIEKTVAQRTLSYKNLEACQTYDLF